MKRKVVYEAKGYACSTWEACLSAAYLPPLYFAGREGFRCLLSGSGRVMLLFLRVRHLQYILLSTSKYAFCQYVRQCSCTAFGANCRPASVGVACTSPPECGRWLPRV